MTSEYKCKVCGMVPYMPITVPNGSDVFCSRCDKRDRKHPIPSGALVESELLFGQAVINLNALAIVNENFRKVIHTGYKTQIVLMSLKPSEKIDNEVHFDSDQIFNVVQGEMTIELMSFPEQFKKTSVTLVAGESFTVVAGVSHKIINPSSTHFLKTYTIYAEPEHYIGRVDRTKPPAKAPTSFYAL